MTRTDIHRPSAVEFDPEAYDCVGVFDLNPEPGFGEDNGYRIRVVNAQIDRGIHFASHANGGQCGHCGARIRYAALMVHAETKVMFYVGETCLENRFEDLTKAEFAALREASKLNRERATKVERRAAHLAAAIEIDPAAAVLGDAAALENLPWFVSDIASKLDRYELSVRQIAAVAKCVKVQAERAARDAEHAARLAAENLTASPVPVTDQRIVITGEIVGLKEVEDNYSYSGGTILKMIVRDDRGFKVYGTMPSKINGFRGDRVTFAAKVEASRDDANFGFFSRPTKAAVLESASAAA